MTQNTIPVTEDRTWAEPANLTKAIEHGLTEAEFLSIKEALGREINVLELGICAALFSEHCSYKSTKVHLKNLPTEGEGVIQGPGENAGIVDIGDGLGVAFKVESHNHPTFIEPYQGAATGVGGILRDVFTMGARPLALMNALRFGAPTHPRTSYLLSRAVSGIGGYGNCMGIPTVGGELFFEEAYDGNCLVNAFALGVVEKSKIFLGKAAGIGNLVMYVGSKTGRDGIHGATMASESFDENSAEKRPTVQVGDPFQEKLLLEACLEAMASGAVVGIQDMGAAGMTSSAYEMADRAGTGVRLHLDRVPQREALMTPYEIMLSESQERMILVVEKGKQEALLKIFHKWELDGVIIGEVIDGSEVELFWHGELASSLPASVLTSSVPQYRWPEAQPADFEHRSSYDPIPKLEVLSSSKAVSAAWQKFLSEPNVCSRRPVFNQYDSTVRSNTVVHPGGDAAVIRVKESGNGAGRGITKGVALTLDCNSRYCAIDPRQGTALSVAEAVRNLASVGAKPIGISDCLNFGSPERPEGMWEIAESIRGLGEAARAFSTPIVSGNVSLYNETLGKAILPTPMIAMVGLIADASKAVAINFQAEGDIIFVIGKTLPELGGSEYLAQLGVKKGKLPTLNYDLELKHAMAIRGLIDKRLLKSCHDLSSGGLAAGLAECCFGNYSSIGASLSAINSQLPREILLFSESGARYIFSVRPQDEKLVQEYLARNGVEIETKGIVGGSTVEIDGVASLDLAAAYTDWSDGLQRFFV